MTTHWCLKKESMGYLKTSRYVAKSHYSGFKHGF